ncbi:ABC transporter ATP-binding protein [Venatoribacter cucullus]|uniref:ABC transporter ATP-binding protein n=1 Tax=Venatoribacter cucullus TaxID=2661630 RepID=UPI00223FB5C3|nr:ABC transporter ATP-binding protein [Venatoribacter cucullus]UZK03511.1 ATP-binding cassette domain-containing protein [Venatoribacter cucullus]
MPTPLLQIQQLSLSYGPLTVLQDFSLTLQRGEILCLLGPSGCGKTSVLKSIAGLTPGARGDIRIGTDTVLSAQYSMPAEERRVGFIFQDYALFPHLTVAENVRYGLQDLTAAEQQQRCLEVLQLTELDTLAGRYPHELSGGQQQRLALARALAPRPRLLLMDEPFSNIDALVKQRMMSDLRQLLRQQDISVIFVTHAKDEAFAFADRMAVMLDGRIAQTGTVFDVRNQPASVAVAQIMESGNLLQASQAARYLHSPQLHSDRDDAVWLLQPHWLWAEADVQGAAELLGTQLTQHHIRLELRMPEGEIWYVDQHELPDWQPGQKLRLHYQQPPYRIPLH